MDLAVVIALPVIAVFGIMGFRDGVVKRVLEILGVFATLILTARFAAAVNPWMMEQTGVAEGPALLITWAALFLGGLLLSRLLASLLSKLVRLTILGWVDKLGGTLVGMGLGVLVASLVLIVISHVPGGQSVKTEYSESSLGRFIYYAAPNFYQAARKVGGKKADRLWDRVLDETKNATDQAVGKAKETAQEAVDQAAQKARQEAEKAAREALEK